LLVSQFSSDNSQVFAAQEFIKKPIHTILPGHYSLFIICWFMMISCFLLLSFVSSLFLPVGGFFIQLQFCSTMYTSLCTFTSLLDLKFHSSFH